MDITEVLELKKQHQKKVNKVFIGGLVIGGIAGFLLQALIIGIYFI